MKKSLSCLACVALFTLSSIAASPASAGELRLSIANGRVTMVAQDVTIRQILDEWSRIGQTVVVGAERLVGPPVTLEMHDVAEARALETLLRSASGYIVKPRAIASGASAYDRILIMPASRAPAAGPVPQQFNNRPQPQVVMPNMADDDMESPILPPGSVPPQQQMQYNQGQPPQPFVVPGNQPGQNQQPTMTAPRPGQLPAAPNVPGNPYQTVPPATVRPPTVPGMPGPGGGPGGGGE